MRQRDILEILCRDGALMHGPGDINGLGRNRRGLTLYVHALRESRQPHRDRDPLRGTHHDHHLGAGFRKSVGIHDDLIVARREPIKAEISERVSGGSSLEPRPRRSNHNGRRRDAPALRILNDANECSSGVLGSRRQT